MGLILDTNFIIVAEREAKTDKMATGDIEVLPTTLEVLNAAELPPFATFPTLADALQYLFPEPTR